MRATAPGIAPRRRASAEETRQRLLCTGRKAFAKKGLASTNLKEDILVPAQVSVGSFYHQFHDKTDLLLAILQDYADIMLKRLQDAHTPAPGSTAEDIARNSYAMVLEIAEQNADLLQIQLRERNSDNPRIRQFLEKEQKRWLASLIANYHRLNQAMDVHFDVELAAHFILGLSFSAVSYYLEIPERQRSRLRERLFNGLVDFTLGGIAALAGEKPKLGNSH